MKDVDKQIDNARAASLQLRCRRKRKYVVQDERIIETLEAANVEEDADLIDLLTLIGLQIQGYVDGLRDIGANQLLRDDSVDESGGPDLSENGMSFSMSNEDAEILNEFFYFNEEDENLA
jgi:hypothetical protein